MRGIATMAAALVVGLSTAAAQEHPDGDAPRRPEASQGGWFSRLWPFGHKAAEKKTESEAPKVNAAESAAAVRRREEAALQRRQAVCDKLREIAIRNRDDALERKAEDLAKLAYDTYELRTQGLVGGASALTDEQALTRRPGSRGSDGGVAARRER
jgi:hypothetical protein